MRQSDSHLQAQRLNSSSSSRHRREMVRMRTLKRRYVALCVISDTLVAGAAQTDGIIALSSHRMAEMPSASVSCYK